MFNYIDLLFHQFRTGKLVDASKSSKNSGSNEEDDNAN